MNPYGVVGSHYDKRLFDEWNNGIRRARAEYELHPFTYCTHNGACDLRWERWSVR